MALGPTSTNTKKKRIVIIGAGPAGLCALKCVLDGEGYKNGDWEVVVFEAREDLGGVWLPAEPISSRDPPRTPLYDSLTTNLPHPLMSFPDFPFPPETPLFPRAAAVLNYLQLYARFHELHPHIQLRTQVVSVDWNKEDNEWVIGTKGEKATNEVRDGEAESALQTEHADLVMISNGHYGSPRFPTTPGVQEWIDRGLATHSMWYRHPPPPPSQIKILVVGAGPSGQDLVADFLSLSPSALYSYTVIHSTTASPSESVPQLNGNTLLRRPRVSLYHTLSNTANSTVTFANGEVEEGIDHVYLATGYSYSYPFLASHILQAGYPPPLASPGGRNPILWNTSYSVHHLARHIWPVSFSPSLLPLPYPPTSLAFLALPSRVSPLPLVEAQARVSLAVFADPSLVDLQHEERLIQERWDEVEREGGGKGDRDTWGRWHIFQDGSEQYDYRESLSTDFKLSPPHTVPSWHRELYEAKGLLRSTWRALEGAGEWETYVMGVGRHGWDAARGGYTSEESLKGAERGWEGVCRRVLERWEEDQGKTSDEGKGVGGSAEAESVDLGRI
ncbi:FAD/NAD(P)-binding domain-containing protein [Coprinellus micaceus]|uniref:FAD/NAD(P)-binding domain-containing protein n=1 Tax=Coprinellus micaceus TaxID=71717 RepID=A0A4Y7SFH6_COPMI|nr:FAD/NAD(P)-binding domain-containing protein [Coprinellus micaceus]